MPLSTTTRTSVMTLESTNDQSIYMTLDELCSILRVSKHTIYKQRSMGIAPTAYRFGKYLRFKRTEVDEWIESKRDVD